jgi:DNA-binding transcriptional LysR family regulator
MLCVSRMKPYDGIDHVKKIWILEQVILTRSFKEAALRAKVTPPAVSQAISALEKVVGKPLVVRDRTGIEPTSAALEIVRAASPALRTLSGLARSTEDRLPAMSWLSFGTYESLAVATLPGLMHRLQARLPDLKLTVRIARTAALTTMVRKGELCAALVTEVDDFGRLDAQEIARDRLGFYVSEEVFSRLGDGVSLASLPSHVRVGVLAPGRDGMPRYFQKFLERGLDKHAAPALLSDSLEALRATAVQGTIVAVLPERVALRTPGELREIPGPGGFDPSAGLHKLCLVSLPSCDPEEVTFLRRELSLLLEGAGYSTSERHARK